MKKFYSAFGALLFVAVGNCAIAGDKTNHSSNTNQPQASQPVVRDGEQKGRENSGVTEEGCPICKIHHQCLTGILASNCASAKVSCESCLAEKQGEPNPKNPKNLE